MTDCSLEKLPLPPRNHVTGTRFKTLEQLENFLPGWRALSLCRYELFMFHRDPCSPSLVNNRVDLDTTVVPSPLRSLPASRLLGKQMISQSYWPPLILIFLWVPHGIYAKDGYDWAIRNETPSFKNSPSRLSAVPSLKLPGSLFNRPTEMGADRLVGLSNDSRFETYLCLLFLFVSQSGHGDIHKILVILEVTSLYMNRARGRSRKH